MMSTPTSDSGQIIVLCGDSMMAAYQPEEPYRGWGQYVAVSTDPAATVVNLAKCGASTKTFVSLGLWSKALAAKPTWVLIQFGHNDSHSPDRPESTDAAGEFTRNLGCMIDQVVEIGARPVLITPVRRRTWSADGILLDNLAPYAAAVQAVATERSVALVDLHRISGAEYLRMGRTLAETWSPVAGDYSHFSGPAAQTVATWVLDALPAEYPRGSNPAMTPPMPIPQATATLDRPAGY